jgi:hypothetical protein
VGGLKRVILGFYPEDRESSRFAEGSADTLRVFEQITASVAGHGQVRSIHLPIKWNAFLPRSQ